MVEYETLNTRLMIMLPMFLLGFNIFAYGVKEDKLINYTIDQLVDSLGNNYSKGERYIDLKSELFESDPHFSLHFTKEELTSGVVIQILVWERRNKRIVVWFKNDSSRWISFSSLEYNPRFVTF